MAPTTSTRSQSQSQSQSQSPTTSTQPPVISRSLFPTDRPVAYVGIDPGENGGIAVLSEQSTTTRDFSKLTLTDYWEFLRSTATSYSCTAVIEQIDPRPTRWFKNNILQSSILRSTCIIYGKYRELSALLVAAGIRFVEVPPRKWQVSLKIKPKEKSESQTDWKRRLKEKAQRLFPEQHVTLATADALLIAEYCRLRELGMAK